MAEEKKRLSEATKALMVAVAIFFDGLQLLIQIIPVVGQILSILISIFASLTFYLWFKINNINFVNPKRAGYLAGGFLIELTPLLNILPAWTLAVVLLIRNSNAKKKAPKLDIIKK